MRRLRCPRALLQCKEQFGFRKLHSTNHVLSDVFSSINNYRVNRHFTCIIFLDLKKAFDTVDHQILLSKLEKLGFGENFYNLFKDYFNNRKQYVDVNNVSSHLLKMSTGVPQGSILGPTLFLLYVNDLPSASDFETRLFADDTVLIMNDVCLSSFESKVNSEMKKVEKWLWNNKLTLNLSKTTFMTVSPINKKLGWPIGFEVKFSGYSLTKSQQTKYLGIFVDENLKWDAHIKYICNKLSHISGIFYKMRRLISQDALIVLYYGLVQSHLTYGFLAWKSPNKTNIQSLQVLQNKIIWTMSVVRRNEHVANNILYTRVREPAARFSFKCGPRIHTAHVMLGLP